MTFQASPVLSTATGRRVVAAALDADRAALGDAAVAAGRGAADATTLADAAAFFQQALGVLWPAAAAA